MKKEIKEIIEQRCRERRTYVQVGRPDLFKQAVEIGSLVAIDDNENYKLAARIEDSVISVIYGLLMEVHPK